MSSTPRRDLVFVSAGLDLDGGGRAAAGRLLAAACADYAREREMGFSILTLGHRFGAGQARLAAVTLLAQARPRTAACVFDFLGPARVEALAPAPLRPPYLVPLYGLEVWRPLSWTRRRALAQAAVRITISEHTVARARSFNPDLPPAEVVPLALEERTPSGAPDADLLARAGRGFVLIVGRLAAGERYKGHDELFAALSRLLATTPATPGAPGARLVVAGDGDDRPRLAARAAELGLRERVLFTGFVSEATLAELYRRAAVFAMPSRGEGFGLVYLEAMRAGIPCVAARGGAAEEVVMDGETGLLVDPASPEELAAALARLLADPGLRARMGEAGQRRWRRDFSAARYRDRLAPLLDRLTGRVAGAALADAGIGGTGGPAPAIQALDTAAAASDPAERRPAGVRH